MISRRAAGQFIDLDKPDMWLRLMFDVIKEATVVDIDRVVDSAVETFLARYGR